MKHIHTLPQHVMLVILAALAAPSVWASGYHFGTQSVSTQGTANASAAEAADPSTIFYNPAGLTKLAGTQATININIVAPSVKYDHAHAYYPNGAAITQTAQGAVAERSGKITEDVVVAPHAYWSHQINEHTWLGLGMFVPFASGAEYDHGSVLRYNLNELSLQSVALQPTVAYRLNEQHSVAAGVVAQNSKASLRQYANLGAFVHRDGWADGYAEVKGNDWGLGYHLAWLWDINEQARLGMNYRSKVTHHLKGHAEWHLTGAGFANHAALANIARGAGYVAREDASVQLVTPESVSVHGMYRVRPQWEVFGDVTWTRHARFNQVNLKFEHDKAVANPVTGGRTQSNETILRPNWRNTYKVAIGAAYQYSQPWQWRFGVAYDQSPVRNDDSRLSTLPDNDRIWLSVGAKYVLNPKHSINAAYSHVFVKNARANVNGWCGAERAGAGARACVSSRTQGSAHYKSKANIVGLQYTYKF